VSRRTRGAERQEPALEAGTTTAEHVPQGTIARGSTLLFGAQLIGNSGFFVAVLLIARALGPTGRGTLAFITVTALVLGKFSKIGVPQATTVLAAQRASARPALLVNLLLTALVGSICVATLACGVLALLPGVRPAGVGGWELVILGLATVAFALVEEAFLLGCGRFRQVAVSAAAAGWIYAVFVAILYAASQLTVAHAALAWAGAQVLYAAILVLFALPGVGIGRPDLTLLRESLGFGLRAWAGSLSVFLNARVDQIIMGVISTERELGIYAVAVNGAELLLYLPSAIGTALFPSIAGGEPSLRIERTLRVFRSLAITTVASVAAGAVLGSLLIPIVFGHAFSPSVGPFLWLLPGALGYAASSLFSSALLGSESPGFASFGPTVSLVVGIVLDFVLIPPFGASGAAAAATAAFMAGGITALALYHARSRFAWGALVPGRSDLETLRGTAGMLLQRGRSGSQAA
jgi:O-antigen/teichoic acid export membrane protein